VKTRDGKTIAAVVHSKTRRSKQAAVLARCMRVRAGNEQSGLTPK